MKLVLTLSKTWTIDTKELDPDLLKDALEQIGFEGKTPSKEETLDAVRSIMESDVGDVVDLSDIDENDFNIEGKE